ncbi:MAG TPA: NAD(P)-binding domain-containing protein, partial [Rhizomicrobium sp.]
MTSIGFIGLGRMGAGMAARLVTDGWQLTVHDVSEDAVASLVSQGAIRADSAQAVGAAADIVFASLPSPQIVEETLLAVAEGGRARIIVDLSTSGSRTAIRLAE